MEQPYPILGFVGVSGSGKTTLIEGIVSRLAERGVRLAILKHARAEFDLDNNPAKDTHRLRVAGAGQVLVASRDRWALMAEQPDPGAEPSLAEMLPRLDPTAADAVLAEGFRHEHYPKIEVFRPALGRPPQCWPADPDVIAVATDAPLSADVPRLDLNDLDAATDFVAAHLGLSMRPLETSHG